MDIEKRINFYGYMRDENDMIYVTFNGNLDVDGVPYTSYTISDNAQYLAHVKEFRKNKSDFENEVFDEADKIVAEVEAQKASTTTTTTVK